ncbi:GntR family transcriptional regulator [Microbacterium aerolatum]
MSGSTSLPTRTADRGPLQRSSLRDDAARVLRARIVGGELEVGRLYSIGEISAELGTSPTPVREALLELANNGLISMVRNRGFKVTEMTDEDLDHLVAIRMMLEVPASAQVAAMHPVPDLADVKALCAEIEDAAARGDLTTFLAVDRDLHLALIGKLGNPRLTRMVGELRDQSRLYGLGPMLDTPQMAESAHEHTLIVDAVEAGDADETARLVEKHLSHIRGHWSAHR